MRFKSIALAGVVCLVWSVASRADLVYLLTDLGSLGGGHSKAFSINDSGQIVGWAFNSSGEYRPTLFDPTGGGGNINLGTGPGTNSGWARWINNAGQIVGSYGRSTPLPAIDYAVLFDPTGGGANLDLGGIGAPTPQAHAWGISDNGKIIGSAHDPDRRTAAVLFDPTGAGSNVDLGGGTSQASSVNNDGQIVGGITPAPGTSGGATIFDPTGAGNNLDLGTLGGVRSSASANNNIGQIVGRAETVSGEYHAALFDPTGAGANLDLGTLGGGESDARSINDNGQIVGWAYDGSGVDWGGIEWEPGSGYQRATLFDPTWPGNNLNLNDLIDPALGWRLSQATDINSNGWIVGFGFNPDGYTRAFLLTPNPVPIPGAILLGLLGLGTAGWRLRKRP